MDLNCNVFVSLIGNIIAESKVLYYVPIPLCSRVLLRTSQFYDTWSRLGIALKKKETVRDNVWNRDVKRSMYLLPDFTSERFEVSAERKYRIYTILLWEAHASRKYCLSGDTFLRQRRSKYFKARAGRRMRGSRRLSRKKNHQSSKRRVQTRSPDSSRRRSSLYHIRFLLATYLDANQKI